MNPFERKIIESTRKLESLEKEYLRLMYESSKPTNNDELWEYANNLWTIGSDAFNIRNEMISEYPNITNLQVYDASVKETLNKIRNNETFYSINFYQKWSKEFEERSGKRFDFVINYRQFLEAKYDDWYDDFYQRFHLTSYYKSIIEIGPIISSSHIPTKALSYFHEIREAYAVDLEYSAIALCRSVMEMCLFDKLQKKGIFKKSKVIQLDAEREDKLHHLIRMAREKKLLDNSTRDMADEIRKYTNQILHPKKNKNKRSNNKLISFKIVSNTVKVIEKLYS
jgi:hypothetical protein